MYRQVHSIERYEGYSYESKPDSDSLTPGSEFRELDTGKFYLRTTDNRWVTSPVDNTVADLLGELLVEMKAIRSGFELALALERGVNIDLRTEAVTAL